jgi:hypothetical protein
MTRKENRKWKMWLLAGAALMAPALMSISSQAAAARPQPAVVDQNVNADVDQDEAGPQGRCPFTCNSDSSCTIGCQTEAKCVNHRCIEL